MRLLFVIAVAASLVGCARDPIASGAPRDLAVAGVDQAGGAGVDQAGGAGVDQAGGAGDLTPACSSEKIRFPQSEGCANDGSVEFCIPRDAGVEARVKAIAPVRCGPGGGRARCDSMTELLCAFTTGPAECTAPHGALTPAAWQSLCRLAALPEVREIVHTIFE